MELFLVPVLWAVSSMVPHSVGKPTHPRIPMCAPPSPMSCVFPTVAHCHFDPSTWKDTWFCENIFTGIKSRPTKKVAAPKKASNTTKPLHKPSAVASNSTKLTSKQSKITDNLLDSPGAIPPKHLARDVYETSDAAPLPHVSFNSFHQNDPYHSNYPYPVDAYPARTYPVHTYPARTYPVLTYMQPIQPVIVPYGTPYGYAIG